jgi:NADPH:quinone reductase-like Zn-dependent oxidoreductase
VGTAAAQLAKQLGCIVFGTARSQWKLERVQSLGVDVAIDTTREDFVEVVRTRTDGRGVDAIVDLVGGDYLGRNLAALAVLGRIAVVGLVAGSAAPLDMRMLLSKRATMVGTVMRARTLDEKIAVVKLFEREVMPWLESGAVAPVVDRVFGLEEAAEAHRVMEANRNFGKLVIRMG